MSNNCLGNNLHYEKCYSGKKCTTKKNFTQKSEIFANWSNWSEWTECSAVCGSGIKKRTRMCDSNSGKQKKCFGKSIEFENCYDESGCSTGNKENDLTNFILHRVIILK